MLERLRSFVGDNRVVSRIRAFMLSRYYPILFCVLAMIGYSTEIEVWTAAAFVFFCCLGLLICEDLRPLLSPLLTFVFMGNIRHAPSLPTYSDYYSTTPVKTTFVVLVALVLLSFVLHYLLWGGAARIVTQKTHLTYFIIPLALALLCNGFFADDYRMGDLIFGVATALCWIVLYLIFVHGLPRGKETVAYFSNCCQWIAILMIAELIHVYLNPDLGVLMDGGLINDEQILFGWGINNNYGGVVVWLLPPLFYLAATRRNGWIQFLLAVLSYVCIIFSMSRTALLMGTIVFVVCLIAVCFCGDSKELYRTFSGVLLIGGCVFLLIYHDVLQQLVDSYLRYGFSDAGRFDIWIQAVEIFKENPIFGGGFYSAPFESFTGFLPGFCHNTVIEMLCVCGGVGLIAYLLYRAKTIWIMVRYLNVERFFLGMTIVAILAVSLLDNHIFNIYPAFFYASALALGELDYDQTLLDRKALKASHTSCGN
jgi:hypothetical protein